MYRYGWPFSSLVARMGGRVQIKLNIIRDNEAGVFVGSSPDLEGLILEAETVPELIKEAHLVIPELMRMRHMPANNHLHILAPACA